MTLRNKLLLLLAGAATLLLSSCNTFRGFGQDVQRAGQGIERTGQQR